MRQMKASEAVGTRVRLIERPGSFCGMLKYHGRIGKIEAVACEAQPPVGVRFSDDDADAFYWRELELVAE